MLSVLSSVVGGRNTRRSRTRKNRNRVEKQRREKRRQLLLEQLEDRRLLAIAITTPIETDNIVNASEVTTVDVSGTANVDALVNVLFRDSTNAIVGQAVTATGGNWSVSGISLASLVDGAVTVIAADLVALQFATTAITKDTVAPTAPTGLDLDTADDTGTSNSDNLTKNTSSLTISGSG